jgi:hypothetical protein
MPLPSIYTPEGAFEYVMLVLALTLVAAVGYLLVFTGASLPL